jgi:ABC-type sugar transport system substrate-binding protein
MTRTGNFTKISKIGALAMAAAVAFGLAGPAAAQDGPFGGFGPPAGWLPPPLDPTGVQLQTEELAPGVASWSARRACW